MEIVQSWLNSTSIFAVVLYNTSRQCKTEIVLTCPIPLRTCSVNSLIVMEPQSETLAAAHVPSGLQYRLALPIIKTDCHGSNTLVGGGLELLTNLYTVRCLHLQDRVVCQKD